MPPRVPPLLLYNPTSHLSLSHQCSSHPLFKASPSFTAVHHVWSTQAGDPEALRLGSILTPGRQVLDGGHHRHHPPGPVRINLNRNGDSSDHRHPSSGRVQPHPSPGGDSHIPGDNRVLVLWLLRRDSADGIVVVIRVRSRKTPAGGGSAGLR